MATWKFVALALKAQRGWKRIPPEQRRQIIENATNLDRLPECAQVVVAPMKVRQANGGPARIFALLPD